MFKAFVIACSLTNADVCMIARDERGPYRTEFLCKMRLTEMTTDLKSMFQSHNVPFYINKTICVEPDQKEI